MRTVLRATAHLCAKRAHRIGGRRRQVQNQNTNTHVRIVARIFPRGISFSSISTRRNIRFPRKRGKRKINRILKSHRRHERGQRRRNGNQLHRGKAVENTTDGTKMGKGIRPSRGGFVQTAVSEKPSDKEDRAARELGEKNSGIGLWRTCQS